MLRAALMGTSARSPALGAFMAWMQEDALPFWAERGFIPASDLFEEALDFSGSPIAIPHRAMVQARQIYVFAHAALSGWHDKGGELAERATDALVKTFFLADGNHTAVAFAVDRSGSITDHRLDSYTHAFVLFALAWMYRLTGAVRFLDLANRINSFVSFKLTDAVHGGLLDHAGTRDSLRRQNPVMHLLEAYLMLEEVAPGRGFLEQSDALVTALRHHIRDGLIIEQIAHDPNHALTECWEPGHHYEWVWLLERHAALAGTGRSAQLDDLCHTASSYGHSPAGLIYDELSPAFIVTGPGHRLWPHTEAIKATLSGHVGSAPSAAAFAEAMASKLMTHFLGKPIRGGWVDRIDAQGIPQVDRIPASSLYHLMIAAQEAAKVTLPTHLLVSQL